MEMGVAIGGVASMEGGVVSDTEGGVFNPGDDTKAGEVGAL